MTDKTGAPRLTLLTVTVNGSSRLIRVADEARSSALAEICLDPSLRGPPTAPSTLLPSAFEPAVTRASAL
ncbi:unnamed protein product [Gadus morhua 'NCC']